MSLALAAIAFDHDLDFGIDYSVPLRLSQFQPVRVPEWVRGNQGPSVAAYIRKRLPQVALILARFACIFPEASVVEIRALTRPTPGTKPGVVPDLPATVISFAGNGDSGWCTFPFATGGLVGLGAGLVSFEWVWQFRRQQAEPWITFDQSFHKIYLVLSQPTEPWSILKDPFNQTAPWVDVLEIACQWAQGAQDTIQAASMITKALNDLGGRRLTYDALVGAPHYTVLGVPRFLCEAFMDRLRGGPGAGPLVNCSDCATIVSTFANILGCDLWQSKMGLVAPQFRLNPILGIGSQSFSTLFGGFGFHEVAWTGDCTALDTVYDACLQTDADADPTTSPHLPSLPVNQLFGVPGSGNYRDQIAAPQDRDVCSPQPGLRIRRSLLLQTTPFASQSRGAIRRSAEDRLRVAEWSTSLSDTEYFFEDFKFFGTELPGWNLTHIEQYSPPAPTDSVALSRATAFARPSKVNRTPRVLLSFWKSAQPDDSYLRVESFDTASSAEAQASLLRIASEIQRPFLEPLSQRDVGEIAFATPDKEFVMFTRGNHVHVVRHVATTPKPVMQQAEYLDDWLTGTGVPATELALTQPQRVPSLKDTANTWKRFVLRRASAQRNAEWLVMQPRTDSGATISEVLVGPGHAAPRR